MALTIVPAMNAILPEQEEGGVFAPATVDATDATGTGTEADPRKVYDFDQLEEALESDSYAM